MESFSGPKRTWIYFLIAAVLFGVLYTFISNLFGKASFTENIGTFMLSAAIWLAFSTPALYIFVKVRGASGEQEE